MSAVRRIAATTLAGLTALTFAVPAGATNPPLPGDGPAADSPGVRVAAAMSGMSLEEKVGQLFVLFAYGPGAGAPDARNTDDARTVGAITGRELRAMGINQDYAPVADVNVNPLNPVIGVRSFSSHP